MPAHLPGGKLGNLNSKGLPYQALKPVTTPATHTGVILQIMTRPIKIASLLLVVTALVGCGGVGALDFPGVYKIGIPQGNIITQDMVDQLRPGMTKRQVIFVMGTPLVRDPFHQDRWDYIYSYQPGGGTRGQEGITVFFEDDQLVRFTGDFVPSDGTNEQAAAQ